MPAVGSQYFTASTFEVDKNGVPMAAAQLFFYTAGTSTPQNTYADATLTTANTNPVIADANGRFGQIWLIPSAAYKVALYTAVTPDNPTGTLIWSEDGIGPAAAGVPTQTAGIVGEIRAFAGISSAIPSGWAACYGQAVSRVTYATAFAALGTTWGAGDGSSTFNLPDLRGRSLFGLDNMGGSPANRVTAAVSNVAGATLGATGGTEYAQQHNHTASSTSNVTDPGHDHGASPGDFVISGAGSNAGSGSNSSQLHLVRTSTEDTGVTVTTTTTVDNNLDGDSQNMPPAAVIYWIIYLGV